ncbi:MAG: FlgD immunoglobulin-like domain containing protein, partial [Victivallales bacterium]
MKSRLFFAAVLSLCGLAVSALDEMGTEMTAVPVPQGKQVVVDGDLSDWDLSGQEWVAVSETSAGQFNGKVAVMYDEVALYVSVVSSTGGGPMSNINKPNERPWQGHDVEFRFVANPSAPYPLAVSQQEADNPSLKPYLKNVATVTAWMETVTKTPYITVVNGPPYKGDLKMEQCVGKDGTLVVFKESSPSGSYVMEARIPWKAANVETGKNPFKPGDKMTAFWTIIWPQMRVEFLSTVPLGGFGWAWHRMGDWGRILFSAAGNLPKKHGTMEEYLLKKESSKDKGTAFEIEIPSEMKASISIFDKDGVIVRELVGGEPRPAGKSKVYWDGYDWRGNPMPFGEYTWKAYASPGLKPVFLGAFSTGGEPSYSTADGKGGWGGDHGQPIDVCSDESGVYFLWDNNEAAKAFVKIGYDDKNLWRNSAFVEGGFGPYSACASNGKYLYVIWGGTKKTYLARFNAANGLSEPFSSDTPYLLVNECQLDKNPVGSADSFDMVKNPRPETIGLAATATEVFATAYSKNKIFVFDAVTGAKLRELDCPWPRGICVDKKGDLFAISCNLEHSAHHAQGSSVLRFPKGLAPSSSSLQLYGLSAPWDIAVDANGRFFVTDSGYSNQIWAYDKNGSHLGWIGKKGGRPYYGAYDKSGMLHPTGVSVDSNGKILVAQNSIPGVFQRFNPDSFSMDQEWFGDIAYGPPSWPSPKDPLTVYAIYKDTPKIVRGTIKGDGSNGSVSAYWDMNKMNLPVPFSCLSICSYTSWANFIGPNGVEFLFDPSTNRPHNARVVFRVKGDELIPIAYVKNLGLGPNDRRWLKEDTGIELWSDTNHDGKVDENEIVRLTELAGQKLDAGFIGMASMWMNAKCDIFLAHASNKIFKIPAKSVDREGAIVWDAAKASIAASDVIPGFTHAGTAPREGILGFRDDPQGNLYTCVNIGKWAGFKYASKEWSEAMLPGPGHTGNFNVVKYEKFGPDGKRIWMAGRKATGTAKPG